MSNTVRADELANALTSALHELRCAATAFTTSADRYELAQDQRGGGGDAKDIEANEARLFRAARAFERARRAVDDQTYARMPFAANVLQAEDLVLRTGIAATRARRAYELLREDAQVSLQGLHAAMLASQVTISDHEIALAMYADLMANVDAAVGSTPTIDVTGPPRT